MFTVGYGDILPVNNL